MAIFNKIDKKTDYSSNVTTIAAGASFTGNLEIACSLHVDGEFNGEIHSTHDVSVGKTGVLKCDLKANKLIVSGKFVGNAECETIELIAGGDAQGRLTAASLSMDGGSSFQGESIRKNLGDAVAGEQSSTVVDFTSEAKSS